MPSLQGGVRKNRSCCDGEQMTDDSILRAYGLCVTRDEFVWDKCIWIADLKDGSKVFQDDDRPGIAVPSAWVRLGNYIKEHPENPIAKMRLRFRSNIVGLPANKPFYFYSKGLLQALQQKHGLDFHIVGWPDDTGKLLCTWYKTPELAVSQSQYRTLADCKPEQLIGQLPPT